MFNSWSSRGAAFVVAVTLAVPAVGLVGQTPSGADSCTQVCLALGALASLRAAIVADVPDAGLATSLTAKVDAATANVSAGNIPPALGEVGAVENEVNTGLYGLLTEVLKAYADSAKAQIANIK